jgi:hypothetical protein
MTLVAIKNTNTQMTLTCNSRESRSAATLAAVATPIGQSHPILARLQTHVEYIIQTNTI